MFLGQYEHTIDEKGRMTIPARYRDLLQDGAYITNGLDRNLMVLTAASFDRMSAAVNAMSMTDPNARNLKRLLFSSAERVEVDRAGRVLIPQYLRKNAALDSQVIVVGVGEFFEIWSPDLWAKKNDELNDPEANNQRFAALDLSIE